MRDVLCTAEPFGYGPSSALAQIVARLRTPGRLSYAGHGHTLDFATGNPRYGGRVTACVPMKDAAFGDCLRVSQAMLTVCDFDAAKVAKDARVPFAIYDPLAWYWPRIPEVCRAADLYICQDFFGVRERLAREGFANATVVPAMTPEPRSVPHDSGALISFGGLGNPHFTKETCADYARAVLVSLHRVLAANRCEPITSLTSKAIASALPVGLEVATLAPGEVHARMARAKVAFLTPGLGQIYEAAALGVEALWLPPANDSQGQQLRLIVEAGMAPGAIDWHEFLDVPPVDYRAPQADVMKTLADHMRRLLSEASVQARFEACVQEKLDDAIAAPDTLVGLIHRFGKGGAFACARVVDRWIESLPEAAGAAPKLRTAKTLPAKPVLTALTLPRENRRVTSGDLAVVRRLHAEVNGTGFNTMAAALEVAKVARERTGGDFRAAMAKWHAGGRALLEKYGGAHCTALAEVLRARLQEEAGLTGRIVCVRYADSKRPLDFAWNYDGTVHADLLVPYLDERGSLNAAHVVTGMGVADNLHFYEGEESIEHELAQLGYTLGEVVDPPELGVLALGTKNKLWVVEGPEARDKSAKLGIDVIEGTIFLDSVAAARWRGPRPPGERVAFPLPAVERAVVEEMGRMFRQPGDFAENVLYLAKNLDAWCEATLCEPGRSLRRAQAKA